VLRFGKSLEVFYGSLKSIHYSDAYIAFTLTVTKISQAIFLFTDHIVWLARSGLFKNIDTPRWVERSNRFWLVSLVMGIVRDVYEINRVISSFTSYKDLSSCITSSFLSIRSARDVSKCFASLTDFIITYRHITIDAIKNVCDLFIPLNALGYVKMSPRIIGLLGVISSLMGLIVILNPNCKLLPQ
jgi:peroxin-11B